jgi:maleate isomerase
MIGWRAKIGLLVPSVNTVLEPEMVKLCSRLINEGLAIYSTRLLTKSEDVSEGKAEEGLELLAEQIEKGVRELEAAKVHVMLYGCTSGSFFKGADWDKEIIRKIEGVAKVFAVTAATGMLEALETLGIKKVSVATPYSEAMNMKLEEFLQFHGFQVLNIDGLRYTNVHEAAQVHESTVYELVRGVNTPDAESVFISCTNFPAIDIIEVLEKDLGKPVITANQALLWSALRKLGIHGSIEGYGQLLKNF